MRAEDLERLRRLYYKVEPVRTIVAAVGGNWSCPDDRCGESSLRLLIPHPDDPSREPNRCPTCLCTAVAASDDNPNTDGGAL